MMIEPGYGRNIDSTIPQFNNRQKRDKRAARLFHVPEVKF